jgi:RHS repeat-associated protein
MNDGIVAHYEYAPFGAIIALYGERVGANPWRFSSEFAEDEMDLVLFNYRHYNEYEGEWLTRDQMNEYGGLNLYAAQGNDVVNDFDLLGEITAGQIVDNFLHPNNFIPVLWVMPQYDEYTLSVRRWKYVKKQESEIKKSVSNNPMRWKALHITSATWTPHTGYGFDPKKGYECLVAHPDGTDPNTARNEYMKYLVFGGGSDKLNWAAIGSFRVAATADYVDIQNCEAQINVWMYNEMSRRSFGRFAERWYFRRLPMASQYMWWNWSLKIKFNGKGEYYDLQTSDAAW